MKLCLRCVHLDNAIIVVTAINAFLRDLLERAEHGLLARSAALADDLVHHIGQHVRRRRGLDMKSETTALDVGDVIDTNGKIRDQILLRAHQTKGNKARSVLLNANARDEIQRYLRRDERERHKPLFTSKVGSRFSPNSLVQVFGRIYRAAGIDLATSHSTRRTFITTLAHKGVNVRVLAAISGHASIATTQRYIDLNENVMRAAVELI